MQGKQVEPQSQAMCNAYEYVNPSICILSLMLQQHSRGYCLRTFTIEAIAASDMLLQQWQPPMRLVPSHSRKLVVQEPP